MTNNRLCTFIFAYTFSVVCSASDIEKDALFEGVAKEACSYFGEACVSYKDECTTAVLPNGCLSIIYFEMAVAKERCGASKQKFCYEENKRYRVKWMHELNLPYIGDPKRQEAYDACNNVGLYNVQSKHLKELEFKVIEPFSDIDSPFFRDYKVYYNCFENKLN